MNKNTKSKEPLFACQECGKKFYSAASADRAAFGDNGCPKCGGSDIDIYVSNPYPKITYGLKTSLPVYLA